MGSYLNPGSKGFQESLNSEIYMDKTGLIEKTNAVLNTRQKFLCVSRPRRFGKSMAADMLAAYYDRGEDSSSLFASLKISGAASYHVHLNQYDVIHLDIQWCLEPAGGPKGVISYISEKTISELKEYYPEILTEKITSLPEALSQINTSTGRKFVIIIDEWDVLIRDEAANQKIQN